MRIRKAILLAVLALLLLSLASAVGAQDDDAYLLPILADGEAVEGEFLTTNDAHLYAFQGTAGDLVTITMQPTDRDSFLLDPYLVLLGQAGQVYAVNDDSEDDKDPAFASAIVDFELPETGSYFIVATTLVGSSGFGSDDTEGGPFGYELSASGFVLPEGADPESFLYSGSSVEIGQSNTLYSNATEPVYFVDFMGEAGQVIDVKTTTDTVTDTILWLFAPNGIRIAINDDSNGVAAELLGVELPEDGKYFMFATGYGFLNAADGSYTQDGNFGISIELASGGGSK